MLALDPITHNGRSKAQKAKELAEIQKSEGHASFDMELEDLEEGDWAAALVDKAPQPAMVMPLDLNDRNERTGRNKQAKMQTDFKVILVQVVGLDPVKHPGEARSIQPAASSRFLAPPRNLERIDLSLSATRVHSQVKYLYWTRQSAKNDASYQPALVQKGGPRIPLTLALHGGCL